MTFLTRSWSIALAAMAIAAASCSAPAAGAAPSFPAAPQGCDASWPGCPCPGDLSKLRITPPRGMKLSSSRSCDEQHGSISNGIFTFAGDMTVTGKVVVRYNEMFDAANVSFEAAGSQEKDYTHAQYVQYAGAGDVFYLDRDDKRLRPPPVSEARPCWVAPAVLRVSVIQVIDSQQDDAGYYAQKYEVTKLGKYRKCTAQEAGSS